MRSSLCFVAALARRLASLDDIFRRALRYASSDQAISKVQRLRARTPRKRSTADPSLLLGYDHGAECDARRCEHALKVQYVSSCMDDYDLLCEFIAYSIFSLPALCDGPIAGAVPQV